MQVSFRLQRIGMKYVNFLSDENIFETGKIKIQINNNSYSGKFSSIQMQKDIGHMSIAQTVVYPLKLNQVLPVKEEEERAHYNRFGGICGEC